MPGDSVGLERDHRPEGNGKARLLTLDHLDGRTLSVRLVRHTESAIAHDLGGSDELSEAQRALARRAAVLSAILEDAEARWADGQAFELDRYLAAVNALRRVLATLGLERRARQVPHLHDYLAGKQREGEGATP